MQDYVHQGREDSNSPSSDQHQTGIDGDLRQWVTLDRFAQSFLIVYTSVGLAVCAT